MSKEFFIPGNTPSSKNGKIMGPRGLFDSKPTKRWKKNTKSYMILYAREFREATKDLPKPLNVEFTFIRDSRRRFDYVNPLQTILDAMTTYDWIDDDNSNEIKPFFGDYKVDKANAGVIIKILNNQK